MGEAIGQVVSFAVVVALSPFPIIGVVLMLATPRAHSNGLAFVGGWIVGLSVAGTAVLLIAAGAGASDGGEPAQWVSILKIVLGILLFAIAAKQFRGRPKEGEEPTMPSWMQAVDHFDARRAAGLAIVLSALNPKNLILIIGAAAAIAQTGADASEQAVALAVFVLIGTLGPAVPVGIYFAMGERSKTILDGVKEWLGHNNAVIMAVFCVVIGLKLISNGIVGL